MDDVQILKEFKRIKSSSFSDFARFGYSKEILEKEFLTHDIMDGNLRELKDFIWYLFNRLIYDFPRDFQKHAQIYWSMAVFDYKYGNGKRVAQLKKSSTDATINHFRSTHRSDDIITYEVVILCGDTCSVCKEDKDKKYEVEEIFKGHPLPHKNCTCLGIGCTCILSFSPKTNIDGLFILNLDDFDSIKKTAERNLQSNVDFQREGAKKVLGFFNIFKRRK